jgi:DNA repair protein RecN (Recombination protein N)
MLQKIYIKNIALIDELEVDFDRGLNVLSGETGAGKSIIIDSIFLLLGDKHDRTLIKHGMDSGLICGVFSTNSACRDMLHQMDFDVDDTLIVRRKLDISGKTDIRINGHNANMSMLRRITSTLVDVYGQNQHLNIIKKSNQLQILDNFLDTQGQSLLQIVSHGYRQYNNIIRQKKELGDNTSRLRELEILKFQIDEIAQANVAIEEEDYLIQQRKLILASEKIKLNLTTLVNTIGVSDNSIVSQLNACKSTVNYLKDIPTLHDALDRLGNTKLELIDILDTLQECLNKMNTNNLDLDTLEKRLDVVRNIKRKYGDYNQCAKFVDDAKKRYNILSNAEDIAQNLDNELTKCTEQLHQNCIQLSSLRKIAAQQLTAKIIAELQELGMKDSVFDIKFGDIVEDTKYTAKGLDDIEFYLSTNVGQPIRPLAVVASGGEMSRFVLCVKTIFANLDDIDTLIFDEIDTGISGIVGQAVAKKLAKISKARQVLCISHLPQIAAMADSNYLIHKFVNNDTTITSVQLIQGLQIVQEISRLTGGINISKQSLNNAQEMLEWSQQYKQSI